MRGRVTGILGIGTLSAWILFCLSLTACSVVQSERLSPNLSTSTDFPRIVTNQGQDLRESESIRLRPPDGGGRISATSQLVAQGVKKKDVQQDEFYDPFAEEGRSGGGEEYDPWESYNTFMFEFNRKVDKYALKPVAQAYNFVLPDAAQVGVKNFFSNLRFPVRFLNNLFQGKVKGAAVELGRFGVNTTLGLAGFVDVAEQNGLRTPEEDTGQTLAVYGMGPGPYLILPFFPPLTVRDAIGYAGDVFLNPINWLVFPIIEVDGIPSVVAHKNRGTTSFVQIGARVGEVINERSLNLETFQGVEEATLDLYSAVRNAYLQKRAQQIRE